MPKADPKSLRTLARRYATAEETRASQQNAEELMELAVDAAQSRHLPEFLERFAPRAARMLGAEWCAVLVFRGRETDLYQTFSEKL